MAKDQTNDGWRHFEAWCVRRGQHPVPPDWTTLVYFIRDEQDRGTKPRELARLLAAVGRGYRNSGLEDLTGHPKVLGELTGAQVAPAEPTKAPVPASEPGVPRTDEASHELVPSFARELPPVLAGHDTAEMRARVGSFYGGVAEMFERWVGRCGGKNTQRAYRHDVLDFVAFLELRWPEDTQELLRVTVHDVQRWRDGLIAAKRAPKTILRRICSLSSFYKYLAGAAAELRLPVNLPNPAHSQFIARESADALVETPALSLSQARQLQEMPKGEDLLVWRDRAILDFYLYTGSRIATGCKLVVTDFHDVEDDPTIRLRTKGNKNKTMGLHWRAADSLRRYLEVSGVKEGPLFRARSSSRSKALSEHPISVPSMYRILQSYLSRLPKAMDGGECRYHPHVLRATTATLLLEKGEDIRKVQELLGHAHVTTTQVYDKRRIATKQSASHDVPI